MLDLMITLNNGHSFYSPGWKDRPMDSFLLAVHRTFEDIRAITIVRFLPQ